MLEELTESILSFNASSPVLWIAGKFYWDFPISIIEIRLLLLIPRIISLVNQRERWCSHRSSTMHSRARLRGSRALAPFRHSKKKAYSVSLSSSSPVTISSPNARPGLGNGFHFFHWPQTFVIFFFFFFFTNCSISPLISSFVFIIYSFYPIISQVNIIDRLYFLFRDTLENNK